MTAFDVIIFDFDGTLADTRAAVIHSMKATLSEALGPACHASEPQIDRAIASGATLSAALSLLVPGDSIANIEALMAAYRARYAADSIALTSLYPGVIDVLDDAVTSGSACTVISNKGEEALRQALAALGILQYFDLVIGEQRQLPPKPAPAIFEHRIQPCYPTTPRRRVLMVGDTLADLQFASNAGIRSCWAQYGYGDPAFCQAEKPDFQVADLYQLSRLLRKD